jgi:hypothetical protein
MRRVGDARLARHARTWGAPHSRAWKRCESALDRVCRWPPLSYTLAPSRISATSAGNTDVNADVVRAVVVQTDPFFAW